MTEKKSSWLKPSLDWLLVFVPVAIALRFIPALENPTVLFVVACLAIIPLAGWMGKTTEHLAERSSAILKAMRNKMDLSCALRLAQVCKSLCLSRPC